MVVSRGRWAAMAVAVTLNDVIAEDLGEGGRIPLA